MTDLLRLKPPQLAFHVVQLALELHSLLLLQALLAQVDGQECGVLPHLGADLFALVRSELVLVQDAKTHTRWLRAILLSMAFGSPFWLENTTCASMQPVDWPHLEFVALLVVAEGQHHVPR